MSKMCSIRQYNACQIVFRPRNSEREAAQHGGLQGPRGGSDHVAQPLMDPARRPRDSGEAADTEAERELRRRGAQYRGGRFKSTGPRGTRPRSGTLRFVGACVCEVRLRRLATYFEKERGQCWELQFFPPGSRELQEVTACFLSWVGQCFRGA